MTPETVWQMIEVLHRAEQMSQELESRLDHIQTAVTNRVTQDLGPEDVSSAVNAPQAWASVSSHTGHASRGNSSDRSDAVAPSHPSGSSVPIAKRIRDAVRARVDEAVLDFIRGPARIFAETFNWFPDPEMSLIRFRELATQQDLSRVEAELTDYVRSRLVGYRKALCEWYPHRASVIGSAFAAHERSEYSLSVPVLLTQADGICFDLTEHNLFVGTHRPTLKTKFKEVARFRRLLLHPLTGELPLTKSAKQRGPDFSTLNRHQVIHGEVTTYGTEENSLRAVSFLFYVGYVLRAARGTSEV